MKRLVATLALTAACTPMAKVGPRLTNRGTRTERSWCDPSRGLPADPSLGYDQPLRLGVASIVHEGDGTSESFTASRALAQTFALPGREASVELIDHPSDSDYSVTGSVGGTIKFERGSEGIIAPHIVTTLGLLVGGTFFGTGLLVNAVSEQDISTVTDIGLLLMGVGVVGLLWMGRKPANHYAWDQATTLTVRRGSVVIGEVVVRDIYDEIHYRPLERLRATSEKALWTQAAREVAKCIEADLAGTPPPVLAKAQP